MLCVLRLVWHEFCSKIFSDLSIRYQYYCVIRTDMIYLPQVKSVFCLHKGESP